MYNICATILRWAVYVYRPYEKMNAAEKELLRLLQRKLAEMVDLQQALYFDFFIYRSCFYVKLCVILSD